jgi:hypothetical protein
MEISKSLILMLSLFRWNKGVSLWDYEQIKHTEMGNFVAESVRKETPQYKRKNRFVNNSL